MEHLLTTEIVEALKLREQHVAVIKQSKEAVQQIDEWLKAILIDNLKYGVNRCNYHGVDIKIDRKKDTPTISTKATPEQIKEAHTKIGASWPFIKYQPAVLTSAYNALSDADKNIISDLVYLRPTAAVIEVSYGEH